MSLLFLISVACVCSRFVCSAPFDRRVPRDPSLMFHKRQVAAQETSNVASWDRRSGTLSTEPGGQQQPANYSSAQVVPAQASSSTTAVTLPSEKNNINADDLASVAATPHLSTSSYPSTQAFPTSAKKPSHNNSALASSPPSPASVQLSVTSAVKTYADSSSSLSGSSVLHSRSNSNDLVGTTQSDPSWEDSYPVYYVSNPEEINIQQQSSQSMSKSWTNQSALHLQSKSNSLVNTTQSDPSRDDSYPVYYVSNPDESFTQERYFQSVYNSRTNKSVPSSRSPVSTASQKGKEDGYPVYYVTGYEDKKQQAPEVTSIAKIPLLPANSMNNSTISSHGNDYPVYYVTSNSKEAPKAPNATGSKNSSASGITSLYEQADEIPIYHVRGPNVTANITGQEYKFEPAANSPITYNIINSTSTSPYTTKSKSNSSQSPSVSAATASQPPPRPAAALNSRPSNPFPPSSYQMAGAASSTSTEYQGYSNYGFPAGSASQTAYQTYSASSPAANVASQPASSYNGYPANQSVSYYYAAAHAPAPSYSPSSYSVSNVASSSLAQSSATQANLNPSPPKNASITPEAPTPSSSSHSVSGVSSSPPFPSGSQTQSNRNKQQAFSVQVSNTSYVSTSQSENVNLHPPTADAIGSSLPKLEADYENSSYIIATPPEKDTVLFLPSSLSPLSPDKNQNENSTIHSSSLNATMPLPSNTITMTLPPKHIPMVTNQAAGNTNSGDFSSPGNATGVEEAANFPIVRIPENLTIPGWELEDITITNSSLLSNSSLGPPPTTKEVNVVSSASTASPIVTIPSPSPSSNRKTMSGDTFNIPLGPLLDSLAATTQPPITKPPQSQFITTPPPNHTPYPVTTKPPSSFYHTTKPTEKNNKWGFGDKYLASQNRRARHRNVIFDGIAGDSQSFSNYQVLSQQEVFFPRGGRRRRSIT